jgi:hypothetical protein
LSLSKRHHSPALPRAPALAALLPQATALSALKWLALVAMTLDHVNTYLLGSRPDLYAIGRLAFPLFACVFGFKIGRPASGKPVGLKRRTLLMLLTAAAAAQLPYAYLRGGGPWPLNVMVLFLVALCAAWWLRRGHTRTEAIAGWVIVVGGGALAEFFWFGLAVVLAARAFARGPSAFTLSFLVAAIASLQIVNGNAWALASLPIVFAAGLVAATELPLPTTREFFYAYYPAHLAVIAAFVFFRGS